MRHPFLGEPTTMKDLIHTKWSDLFPGLIFHYIFIIAIWGGLCWALGTYGYCLGAPKIGFAVAYVSTICVDY